jgi:hypothetical protein
MPFKIAIKLQWTLISFQKIGTLFSPYDTFFSRIVSVGRLRETALKELMFSFKAWFNFTLRYSFWAERRSELLNPIKVMAVFVVTVFFLTGCLYSHVKTPLDTDIDITVLGQKVGKSSLYSVLWLFAWGDMSVAAAAKNGGITTLRHMDGETYQILFGLYTKQSIIVYGD